MKKIILLVIVFATLLSLANVFAANPRTVMQLVQYANGTQPPYTVGPLTLRAWFAERPTEILTSIANPTLVKFQNLTTAPAGTYASVNCSGFASAWSTAGGEHLTLEITDTQHGNVMVTTIIVTPSGSALIKITTPIFIPWPVVTTTLVPAENPTPATGAPGVAVATSQVSWTYPVNAETITPAVGYRVKFGTASDLAGVSAVYVTGTTFTLPALAYNTTYYWQVVPTDASSKKNAPKTDASNCPIWNFHTESEVLPPNTIYPTEPGAFDYPASNPLNTIGIGFSGTISAPGTLVFGEVVPAKAGTYHGYLHVEHVYTVSASDQAILNHATLNFNYGAAAGYKYVAIHWGGTNDGYYPIDHPETAGITTPGYYFNGGVSEGAPYDFPLGMAPFTGAGYAGGILTVGPIPNYTAKDAGIFEIILGKDVDLPVELSSFNAVATAQMFVSLQWTTESETNNLGFNVLRSEDSNLANAVRVNNMGIIGGTNTSTEHTYKFDDTNVEPQTTYYYWLEMVNNDLSSTFTNYVMVATGDNNNHVVPPVNTTVLRSAFPNPFSASSYTTISFDVKNNENATLTIYNVLGQTVKTFVRTTGSYNIQWNGRDDRGAQCGSGIYFYKLTSPSVNATKKMVIVK
ncbi:MAG TPA: T9SS type A sorting domain-containing protein [Candidatus Cloacimonadota bacterium]|nr:T9SS type A sorting domain-containing protein [Candidatus Cloacimonadota bacterium]HPT71587.1 T9SS type A sorting domain-containing protein [Candidatus Cloacimonadota bacterium]